MEKVTEYKVLQSIIEDLKTNESNWQFKARWYYDGEKDTRLENVVTGVQLTCLNEKTGALKRGSDIRIFINDKGAHVDCTTNFFSRYKLNKVVKPLIKKHKREEEEQLLVKAFNAVKGINEL